jgi:hypothetical protein
MQSLLKSKRLINREDSPEDEWTPPSYAEEEQTKTKSAEGWKPPSYAAAEDTKPVESERDKEKKKHTFFGDLKNAIGETKKQVDDFVTDIVSKNPKHPYLSRLITSQDPSTESILPDTKKELGFGEPTSYKEGFAHGLYENFLRPYFGSPAGAAGLITGEEGLKGPAVAAERGMVGRSEIPYRMGGSAQKAEPRGVIGEKSPLQTSADRIVSRMQPAAEEIPVKPKSNPVPDDLQARADVIIKQIQDSQIESVKKPEPKAIVADFIKIHPDAKMGEVKKFISSVVREEAPIVEAPKKKFVNPFEGPVVDEKGLDIAPEQNTPTELPIKSTGTEVHPIESQSAELPIRRDILRDLTGEKFNPDVYDKARDIFKMGKDLPEAPTKSAEGWKPPDYAQMSGDAAKVVEPSVEQPKSLIEQIKELQSDEHPLNKSSDDIELQAGLGGIKPSKRPLEPSTGPYATALDKLFNSMGTLSEKRLEQDVLNKTERARRFANFNSVDEVGVKGAKQSLSHLKGEFNKVDLDKLKMTAPQVDSLFTAVKRANITAGEKARGYTTLFKLFNGEIPQRNELALLDEVFGNNFAAKITEMHGGIGAVGMNLSKLNNTAKTLSSVFDLSPLSRNAGSMILRREYLPAARDFFKFLINPEFYRTSMKALEERPGYLKAREAGLFTSKAGTLRNSEESFMHSYIGDIPGVRNVVGHLEQATIGFMNKLRSDVYDSMALQAERLGNKLYDLDENKNVVGASKEAKAIANYINTVTGRGNLNLIESYTGKKTKFMDMNKMTEELNQLLWSPRMMSSRIQMFTNPKLYMDLPKGMRREGLRSLLGIAAMGLTIDGLAKAAGAKISTNILSSDFGKSRFGNHVIDPWNGFQQYVVAAARFIAGKTDSDRPTSRGEIAGRFLSNKLSPGASLAQMLAYAKKFTGKSDDPKTAGNLTDEYGNKTSVQRETLLKFAPMMEEDLRDLVTSDPEWAEHIGLTAAMTSASALGMAQNYPERKKSAFGKMRVR